jgi:hypothetical protein
MRLGSSGAVFVLLAIAGCGAEDDTFTEDYNRAVRPLSALGGSLEMEARDFDRLAGRTERARANLAELDPPEEARVELDRLMASLDVVTRDLGAVARASRSKNRARQRRAARRLVEASERVEQAESALVRAVQR